MHADDELFAHVTQAASVLQFDSAEQQDCLTHASHAPSLAEAAQMSAAPASAAPLLAPAAPEPVEPVPRSEPLMDIGPLVLTEPLAPVPLLPEALPLAALPEALPLAALPEALPLAAVPELATPPPSLPRLMPPSPGPVAFTVQPVAVANATVVTNQTRDLQVVFTRTSSFSEPPFAPPPKRTAMRRHISVSSSDCIRSAGSGASDRRRPKQPFSKGLDAPRPAPLPLEARLDGTGDDDWSSWAISGRLAIARTQMRLHSGYTGSA